MTIYRQSMHLRMTRFFKRFLLFFIALAVVLSPLPADALELLLGTDQKATFSHFAGRTISRLISTHSQAVTCQATPSTGAVHNLTNLKSGSLDLALVDSRMLHDAIRQKGSFEFLDIRYDNLRVLAPLYHIPVTLVVRKDSRIASLDGVRGKRLNAGTPGSLQHQAVETLLTAKNWSEGDFNPLAEISASQSQDTMAFCHGTVQSMIHIGVHPDAPMAQLRRLCDAGFISMDDTDIQKLVEGHPAYSWITIPADTYASQSQPVKTFGTEALLVTTEDLDDETTRLILGILKKGRQRMKGAHPALAFPVLKGKTYAGIPLHPEAVKFFSDN